MYETPELILVNVSNSNDDREALASIGPAGDGCCECGGTPAPSTCCVL